MPVLESGGMEAARTTYVSGQQSRLATRLLFATAICAIGAIAFASLSGTFRDSWVGAMLTALALAAHLLPVRLGRGGLQIVFTLPYVAGVAQAFGFGAALAVDVGLALIVGLDAVGRHITFEGMRRVWLNASIAGVSVISGTLFAIGASIALPGSGFGVLIGTLAFTVGHGAMNLWLVKRLRTSGIGIDRGALTDSFKPGLLNLSLYLFIALAVGVFLADGMPWLIPITLVPVWALRQSLMLRARMFENYCEAIGGLNAMLQRAHPYTHGHLERVSEAAEEVALRLGLSHQRARKVREAAILHDIGKIAVDEEILDKPGKLTVEEMDHVRNHSEWGAQILSPIREFMEIVPWIRHHHERPDGTGYPARLSLVEIPIESRIIAVVDAFDAMTGCDSGERRSYREPVSKELALAELRRCEGTQFDPSVVSAFCAVMEGGKN